MQAAQLILDCYPDFVSEYGLIGCLTATTLAADVIAFAWWLIRR
jgi:hypothetical protein